MSNANLSDLVTCPKCNQQRMMRRDVIKRVLNAGRDLTCKPCHNRHRFDDKNHSRKGTGVKNDASKIDAYKSYTRAKRRCEEGAKHHQCYEKIEFRFKSFDEFFDHLGPRPEGMSIDRIDPLGHYEAGNVRWATAKEQAQNRMPRNYWKKVVNGTL